MRFFLIFILFFINFNCYAEFQHSSNKQPVFFKQDNKSGKNGLPELFDNNSVKTPTPERFKTYKTSYKQPIKTFSQIEKDFMSRLKFKKHKIRQFGYDFFIGSPKLSLSSSKKSAISAEFNSCIKDSANR